MKEMDDDELQRLIENSKELPAGRTLNDGEKAYHALLEVLKSEPENGLPYNFAAKVTRHIQAEQKHKSEWKYNLATAAILLCLVVSLCGVMAVFGAISLATLLKYKWLIILLPVVFIVIQHFDQVLVKTRAFRNNLNN